MEFIRMNFSDPPKNIIHDVFIVKFDIFVKLFLVLPIKSVMYQFK